MSGLYDQQITILLAEDDPGDQELTRRALEDEGLNIDLRIVADGEEAAEYLRRWINRGPGGDVILGRGKYENRLSRSP